MPADGVLVPDRLVMRDEIPVVPKIEERAPDGGAMPVRLGRMLKALDRLRPELGTAGASVFVWPITEGNPEAKSESPDEVARGVPPTVRAQPPHRSGNVRSFPRLQQRRNGVQPARDCGGLQPTRRSRFAADLVESVPERYLHQMQHWSDRRSKRHVPQIPSSSVGGVIVRFEAVRLKALTRQAAHKSCIRNRCRGGRPCVGHQRGLPSWLISAILAPQFLRSSYTAGQRRQVPEVTDSRHRFSVGRESAFVAASLSPSVQPLAPGCLQRTLSPPRRKESLRRRSASPPQPPHHLHRALLVAGQAHQLAHRVDHHPVAAPIYCFFTTMPPGSAAGAAAVCVHSAGVQNGHGSLLENRAKPLTLT